MSDSSKDSDFNPKETVEEDSSEDEKFLNRRTGSYAPQAAVYTITVAFIGIGFVIGFSLGGGFVTGMLCLVQIMSTLTGNPTQLQEVNSIQTYAKEQLVSCASTTILSPIPLMAGIVFGAVAAYPAYKMAKAISSGTYLKSLV